MAKKKKKILNKPPAFQLYAKDILAHAAREMTLDAFGAYVILLCFAWDSDPIASLPNSPHALRRIVGAGEQEWKLIWAQIEKKFQPFPSKEDELLYNKRLHRQWTELKSFSDEQTERANRRWQKEDAAGEDPASADENPFAQDADEDA